MTKTDTAQHVFVPSKYQLAIFDHVEKGRGDGFAEAVAGSGKTKTLEEVAKRLHRLGYKALFLAFNKHIAEELKKRLPTTQKAGTLHSRGYYILSREMGEGGALRLDDNKYMRLIREYLSSYNLPDKEWTIARNTLGDLVDYVRTTLTNRADPIALKATADHFGIIVSGKKQDHWGFYHTAVRTILDRGVELAKAQRIIDFTDMIWLPIELDLPAPTFRFVLVDEAQDLSPCQRELAMRHRARGGRMLFVGDRRQAIYGFSGADSASVDNIITATRAKTLPLSVCYRCPRSHIELAQQIVPHIEAADTAEEGIVAAVKYGQLTDVLKNGDLILSRTTRPLIALCYHLIRNGVKAKVRGREIGKGLISTLKKIMAHDDYEWHMLVPTMDSWLTEQVNILERDNTDGVNDNKIAALEDRVGALRAIFDHAHPKDPSQFTEAIESLFTSDSERPPVMLSTIHRAKGLENDRVFLLHPTVQSIALGMRQAWQQEQEQNLTYVALTRAKKELHFIQDEGEV